MITYVERQAPKIGQVVDVFLDGRKVGIISRVVGGWQYQVNKTIRGEVLPTITDVKRSIEAL